MIGVVIPAHNEEDYLRACLLSVQMAALHPGLRESVRIAVVLDACTDRSGEVAADFKLDVLQVEACNVGAARAAGAAFLLDTGVRWLAFTDADSVVSHAWLAAQLALGSDAVCGTVSVDDWTPHGEQQAALRRHFSATYCDRDEHRHIHGANLGVSASAYCKAGGFPPLPCGEDVALVQALIACGARIAWSAAPRVTTSSRIASHARGGFGDTLHAVAQRL